MKVLHLTNPQGPIVTAACAPLLKGGSWLHVETKTGHYGRHFASETVALGYFIREFWTPELDNRTPLWE